MIIELICKVLPIVIAMLVEHDVECNKKSDLIVFPSCVINKNIPLIIQLFTFICIQVEMWIAVASPILRWMEMPKIVYPSEINKMKVHCKLTSAAVCSP